MSKHENGTLQSLKEGAKNNAVRNNKVKKKKTQKRNTETQKHSNSAEEKVKQYQKNSPAFSQSQQFRASVCTQET